MVAKPGIGTPNIAAIAVFTKPATTPLLLAMKSASDAETFRVRLLSIAQHKQATPTNTGPAQSKELEVWPGHDSTTPPATMATMPHTKRLSALSLKTSQAMVAVKTASRFSKRDALDPLVLVRPNIKAKGPNTPPNRMAPSSQGHSPGGSSDARHPRSRIKRIRPNPIPLPKYSKPARRMGDMSPTSNLANGVLAPNKMAAPKAKSAARFENII